MGAYIVDFVCHSERLIVEVDGGVHRLPSVAARDAERDSWLTARGYRIVRVSSGDAASNPHSVVQLILDGISADTPTPSPSPQGGGELME